MNSTLVGRPAEGELWRAHFPGKRVDGDRRGLELCGWQGVQWRGVGFVAGGIRCLRRAPGFTFSALLGGKKSGVGGVEKSADAASLGRVGAQEVDLRRAVGPAGSSHVL